MTTPYFSIITVCFNSESTIRSTLDAMLAQTCQDYEYLVIDGASKDNTVEILKEYVSRFSGKMRYISEPDKGIFDAMDKGITMAQGEIIGIINSDDYYLVNTLENVKRFSSNNDADLYYGAFIYKKQMIETVHRSHHLLLNQYPLGHPSTFIRRSAYQKFGDYDRNYRITADYELMLRFRQKGAVFCPLNDVLAVFTLEGISNRPTFAKTNEGMRIAKKYNLFSTTQYYWHWIIEMKNMVKNFLFKKHV